MTQDNRAELATTPFVHAEDLFPANHRLLEQLVNGARLRGHRRALIRMCVHVSPQDGVNSRLVAGLAAEPFEKIGTQSDGHALLRLGCNHRRILSEGLVGGSCVRIIAERSGYFLIRHRAYPPPVGFGLSLRGGSRRIVAHEAPTSRPI